MKKSRGGPCGDEGAAKQVVDKTFEDEVNRERDHIRAAMREIGRRHERGDESQIVHWVVPGLLGCAQRPLRHHPQYGESGRNLVPEAAPLVRAWASRMLADGVRSILSLMHERDLRCYLNLNLGAENLIAFYEQQGLEVRRVPWEDPHHKASPPDEKRKTELRVRQEALKAFDALPKPVIVQCSACIDRSAPVAACIYVMRRAGKPRG